MSLSDPIANMLTLVRNASRAKHEKVDIPNSKLLVALAGLLKDEGFIDNLRVIKDNKQGVLRLYLRYVRKRSVINNIRRVSRPGLRVYKGAHEIPRVLRGRGTAILSTSKGLMTDVQAREAGVGGEILCYIW